MSKFICLSMVMGAVFAASSAVAAVYSAKSPDGKIEAFVEDGAQLAFSLKADGKTLLDKCAIGMDTDRGFLGKDAELAAKSKVSHRGVIENKFGTRKNIADNYTQLTLDFGKFNLLVRVYI